MEFDGRDSVVGLFDNTAHPIVDLASVMVAWPFLGWNGASMEGLGHRDLESQGGRDSEQNGEITDPPVQSCLSTASAQGRPWGGGETEEGNAAATDGLTLSALPEPLNALGCCLLEDLLGTSSSSKHSAAYISPNNFSSKSKRTTPAGSKILGLEA